MEICTTGSLNTRQKDPNPKNVTEATMLSRAAGLRRRFTGKWRVGCASSRHTEADKRVGHVLDLLTEHCVEWDGFFSLMRVAGECRRSSEVSLGLKKTFL